MNVPATRTTHVRRSIWVAGTTSILAMGWLWYDRPIREAARIGVDAERLRRRGGCVSVRGEISCGTPVQLNVIPRVQEQVDINPWTRSLLQARRSWTVADSADWVVALDSIRRTVRAARGEPVPCDASETGFPVVEAWMLGSRELRLYAGGPFAGFAPGKRWFISAHLVQPRSAGCGLLLTHRPTIAEMDSMARVWMQEHLPF